MFRRLLFGLGMSLLLAACTEKETPAGVKFSYLKKGDGEEVPTGKYIMVHMILHDFKDSLLLDTYQNERPMVMPMPDESMADDTGEYGVYKMLTKGDCVTFQLPAQTVFTKRRRPVPKKIDPASLYRFVVHLKEAMTFEEAKEYEKRELKKMAQKQQAADSATIENYLKENNLAALSGPEGLRYIVQKEGKGDLAKAGNVAMVHYAGFLLNGKIFDTSMAAVAKANGFNNGQRNEPYRVVVGAGGVIQGWEEMILLMNKGMKVTVFIPSALAYGLQGSGQIPPNAVIKFDMELVDLK
jgi:FKBP-type peptidyl-prolyl cis-trans isomerase FkpA